MIDHCIRILGPEGEIAHIHQDTETAAAAVMGAITQCVRENISLAQATHVEVCISIQLEKEAMESYEMLRVALHPRGDTRH